MELSNDLVKEFAKMANGTNSTAPTTSSTVYGTIVTSNDEKYVQLDGSDQLTPISTLVVIKDGDRVMVTIKDHVAMVTGNLTSPSASDADVSTLAGQVQEVEKKVADFDEVYADKATVEELKADFANIDTIVAEKVDAELVEVDTLVGEKVDAKVADLEFVTAGDLEATNAEVHNLAATYAAFEKTTTENLKAVNAEVNNLDTTYATIDFSNIGMAAVGKLFSESGIIEDLVVGSASITGELVGVTLKGDLIEAGTVKADKLVVKGSDGLYYKLNIDAGVTATEQVPASELQNGLHGDAIIANTITAEKINVTDLVAFGATIGGLKIANGAIYSGAKSGINNTTTGIYIDDDGQMNLGDANSFVKFHKQADGTYKLDIQADSVTFAGSGQSVEDVITDAVNGIDVGGRNLLIYSLASPWNSGGLTVNADYATGIITGSGTYYIQFPMNLLPNTQYTFSYDSVENSGSDFAGNVQFALWDSSNRNYLVNAKTVPDGGSVTFTTPSGMATSQTALIYITHTATTDYTLSGAKLEKGNKVTDWTPAPEDIGVGINGASSLARSASASASDAYVKAFNIEENIYVSGTTTIDGGNIATNSIKADSIDVDNLFAQDITATGTITGATLIGGSIEAISENGSRLALSDNMYLQNPSTDTAIYMADATIEFYTKHSHDQIGGTLESFHFDDENFEDPRPATGFMATHDNAAVGLGYYGNDRADRHMVLMVSEADAYPLRINGDTCLNGALHINGASTLRCAKIISPGNRVTIDTNVVVTGNVQATGTFTTASGANLDNVAAEVKEHVFNDYGSPTVIYNRYTSESPFVCPCDGVLLLGVAWGASAYVRAGVRNASGTFNRQMAVSNTTSGSTSSNDASLPVFKGMEIYDFGSSQVPNGGEYIVFFPFVKS